MMIDYKDIKKFTSYGSYHVDVSMKRVVGAFREYENEGLICCPDFQRGHVWTEDQQREYIEFILRGGSSGRDFLLNHPGWMDHFNGEFVLVDGLQRLATLRKFYDNALPVFGGNFRRDFLNPTFDFDVTFHIHVNNLKTRAEVLAWYIELNSGGTPHTKQEIERVKELLEKEIKTKKKQEK